MGGGGGSIISPNAAYGTYCISMALENSESPSLPKMNNLSKLFSIRRKFFTSAFQRLPSTYVGWGMTLRVLYLIFVVFGNTGQPFLNTCKLQNIKYGSESVNIS